jgi:nucleoside-diphosphate-sugar epimerase
MRFGNIIAPAMYERFYSFIHDPSQRVVILWSYIDSRDCASACRLAIEKDGLGAVAINVAADNTSSDVPSREMMQQFFPEVTDFRAPLEQYESLLSNTRAKQLLGWAPKYNWRHIVKSNP